MRDFPRELVIGGSIWRVRFRRLIEGNANTLGLCCPATNEISIKTGQTPSERFKTFVHELIHAINYEYSLKENHKTVYKLETILHDLFVDNGLVI